MQTAYLLHTCSAANCAPMVVESPDPAYISIGANKLRLANCDEEAAHIWSEMNVPASHFQ